MPPEPDVQARLGLRLALGALLMVAAAAVFGVIAEDVVNGARLTRLDLDLANWFHAHPTAPMTAFLLVVTNLHSTVAVSIYAVIACLALYAKRRFRWLATVFVCIAGGLVLNVLVKLAFRRARPSFDDPLLTLSTYSFPSGHVMGTTLAYGLAVVFVFTQTRCVGWRLLALLVALLAIATVALSRMYLGVHYLSDVGAAFTEGIAWLALCLTAMTAFWREAARSPLENGASRPAR